MPTVLSPNKGYSLQQTGENAGTWGVVLDQTLSIIDLNMGGVLSLSVAGGSDVTLTSTQAENAIYNFTGALTGNISVKFPAVGSFYIIKNSTTGDHTMTVKTTAGGSTGPVIPQGALMLVYTDGTNAAPSQNGVSLGGVDSGTGSAYVVTTPTANTALYQGYMLNWVAGNDSAAAATLAPDGLTAKVIYQPGSNGPVQVTTGYIQSGDTLLSIYDTALNAGAGGWYTIGGLPPFSAITVTDSITIVSTDSGASAAPTLDLYRDSSTPASADLIGQIEWNGQNSTPAKATFVFEEARIDNPVAGSETGSWLLNTAQAGSLAARLTVGAGVQVGAPTGGDKGAGTINATAAYANGVPLITMAPSITGLLPTSVAGTSTTASLTVTAGYANDSTFAKMLNLATTQAWSVTNGNAANGYQGGTTLPNSSSIHFFLCEGTSGQCIFANNSLTITPPTGYTTYQRRIFSLATNSSGALVGGTPIQKAGGSIEYLYSATNLINNATAVPTSATLYTFAQAPSGIILDLILDVKVNTTSGTTCFILFASPSEPDDAPTSTTGRNNLAFGASAAQPNGGQRFMLTSNTSAQFRARASSTSNINVYMWETGFIDYRVS